MVTHRSFSLPSLLHGGPRDPLYDDLAISSQSDVAEILQAILLPVDLMQCLLNVPHFCTYFRVFRVRVDNVTISSAPMLVRRCPLS